VADAFETLLHRLTTTADQRAAQTWQSAASVLGEIRRNGKVMQTVQQKSSAVAVWNTARQRASEAVVQTDYPVQTRLAALHFVLEGTSDLSELQSLLAGLLTPETAPELQQEAAKAIAASGPQMIQDELLDRWNSLTPSIRSAAIGAMLTQTRQTAALLEAIRSGQLSAGDVDAVYRERLVNHRNAETAQLAKELFQTDQHSNRQQLVDEFTASLATATGDAVAGKAVFQKRCATCHKLQDIGKAIGADLAALKDRSTPAMLTAILDPNRAVESKFISYTALTTDGRTFNGMLLSETGNSLTLMGVDGKEQVIARNELEELISSNRSLMPEGLEKDLSAKDLIDVITFVQTSGNTWKSFPGNQPELVAANADGTMTLPASAAEIYGPNLIFEGQYGNLGWWQSTDDYAVWTIDAPASGHWTVEFDFACDNGTAGNVIKLSTGTRLLSARVPGTGTWNDYRTWQAGTIDLRRGRNQLIVSAPEQPSSALIDLRAIRLIPPE
jgi:putative heme-binding domain-containing protein